MSTKPAPLWQVITALSIIYVVWGSTYLAIRYAIEAFPPFLMAGVRFILAGLILLCVVWKHRPWAITRRQWLSAGAIGVLLLLGGNGLVCYSEKSVDSSMAALLIATMPIWMILLDWTVFGQRRPTAAQVFGILLGTAGVALLAGLDGWAARHVDPLGAMLLMGACFSWSMGSLLSRRLDPPKHPLINTGWQMLLGGAGLLLSGFLLGEVAAFRPSQINAVAVWAFGYLVLVGSIAGFTAYVWLLDHCSTAVVATYAYVNPVIAVLLGYLIAREPVTERTLVGAGMILAAVILITRLKKPEAKSQAPSSPSAAAVPTLATPGAAAALPPTAASPASTVALERAQGEVCA